MNNGHLLRIIADEMKIPLRTLNDVRKALREAKTSNSDIGLARLMLQHGRLTPAAREFAIAWWRQ